MGGWRRSGRIVEVDASKVDEVLDDLEADALTFFGVKLCAEEVAATCGCRERDAVGGADGNGLGIEIIGVIAVDEVGVVAIV